MYIAGAQILANYPVGPLAGVAFNLTLLSYCGSLDMGLNLDAAAVEDPGAAPGLHGVTRSPSCSGWARPAGVAGVAAAKTRAAAN